MESSGCLLTTQPQSAVSSGEVSKLLHELVLQLRKAKLEQEITLHVVHAAGTRMNAQGTDGLSRGIFLEGVMRGEDMLSFVDLARA